MTYGSTDGSQPGDRQPAGALGAGEPGQPAASATQPRDEAREKAKTIREQHRKQEKKTRLIIQGTVLLFSVAIVGIVAIILVNGIRPDGPGPLNMRSDGIVIGEGFAAEQTAATRAGADPLPTARDADSNVITIDLYVDYFCKICGAFEEANGEQIATLVESGAATLEIHPLAVLDRVSQGTKYSTRSANAAACVANFSPDAYYAFHTALFDNQPEENTPGLTDKQLADLATKAKATRMASITDCITEQRFKTWVAEAKDRALTGPIPNADVDAVETPPTIIVNGVRYTGAANDADAFAKFVLQAAGTTFNEDAAPSPSPSPSASPTPSKAP